MKQLIRQLLRRSGFELLHHSADPVLTQMRLLHERLRLQPGNALEWDDSLSHPPAASHLRNLLELHQIDLVLDVGANRGQFAGLVRELGFKGRLVSFEPQSALQTVLKAAAAGDPEWIIMPCAVGSDNGTLSLQVFRNDAFSSLHAINAFGRQRFTGLVAEERTEQVEIRTLDSLWPEIADSTPRRVLLKTDTQGHDLAVLQGATAVLGSTKAILTEAALQRIYDDAPLYGELAAWLAARDFVPSGLYPISHRPEDLALIEMDAFFTRTIPAP
jgi:FkbM family methyltransferase